MTRAQAIGRRQLGAGKNTNTNTNNDDVDDVDITKFNEMDPMDRRPFITIRTPAKTKALAPCGAFLAR